MPELPEVEAARRAIEEHCVGRRVVRCVAADDSKVIDGVSPRELESSLAGKTLLAALRKGKNLWIRFDSPPHPSFQFGMTGAVYIKGVAVTKYKRSAVSDSDEWPSKFSKVFIEFDDGLELSFTDKRRFAKVRLLEDPVSVPPICELGPDALLEPMIVDEFSNALAKKKIAIKTLLLEQSFISGIGNWIADEVLYQAGIHPLQIAATLTKETCETLLQSIKEVIEKAIGVGADSSQFPRNWIFHSREKKPGKAFADGKKIEFITVGGRTTAYIPELQRLTGGQLEKSASSKPQKAKSLKKQSREDSDEEAAGALEDEAMETEKHESKKRGRRLSNNSKAPPKKTGDGDGGQSPLEKQGKKSTKKNSTSTKKNSDNPGKRKKIS